ncbi:MAG: SOS response-associated peptidase [Pseudomonadota bacterium]
MPGRLFLETPLSVIAADLGLSTELSDPPRRNISPGEEIAVVSAGKLLRMRWGMIPVGRVNARGRPVMETIINARSETVFDKSAFDGVGRAVMLADGWYEWTGSARRKQPWRIRAKDRKVLFFAAITDVWDGPGGLSVPQVAAVTCAPSADVRDIHHRMGVLLARDDVETWLSGDVEAARLLMVPYPDGSLRIEKADDVDWSAP